MRIPYKFSPIVTAAMMLFVIGVFVRMSWFGSGGHSDLHINTQWGLSAVHFGLVESYEKQISQAYMTPNYPPLSLYIFETMTKIYMSNPLGLEAGSYEQLVRAMKIPAIAADLLTAGIIVLLLARLTRLPLALLGGAVHWANPAVMYNSVYWGQTDSIFTLFIVLSYLSHIKNRPWLTGICGALAFLCKPQAVIVAPVLFVMVCLRKRNILPCIAGFVATFLMSCVPFVTAGKFSALRNMYLNSIDFYTHISVNAYNFWWMLMGKDAYTRHDTTQVLGSLSAKTVGMTLFIGTYALVCAIYVLKMREEKDKKLKEYFSCMALSACYFSFFLFSTQMHERYLFVAMPFLCVVALYRKEFIVPYVLSSLGYLFNMSNILNHWKADDIILSYVPTLPLLIGYVHLLVFFLMAASLAGGISVSSIVRNVRQSFGTLGSLVRSSQLKRYLQQVR